MISIILCVYPQRYTMAEFMCNIAHQFVSDVAVLLSQKYFVAALPCPESEVGTRSLLSHRPLPSRNKAESQRLVVISNLLDVKDMPKRKQNPAYNKVAFKLPI